MSTAAHYVMPSLINPVQPYKITLRWIFTKYILRIGSGRSGLELWRKGTGFNECPVLYF